MFTFFVLMVCGFVSAYFTAKVTDSKAAHASLGTKHFGDWFMKGDGESYKYADSHKIEDLKALCP